MTWLWIGLGGVGLAALLYWQLVIAEGAYLGPQVVAWTYDWVAKRYDAIKQFNPRDESWFVAGPLLRGLQGVERPVILDVATGTGRLPLALLRERFRGQIVGLDLSWGMLRQARTKLRSYGEQVLLVRQDANNLPFDDGQFDAVTCLEALEFMPHPEEVLQEMVRVLAPGGVLLLTNRVGREARLLPHRAIPRPLFAEMLATLPLTEVEVRPWQVNYDLAVARKARPAGEKTGHVRGSGRGSLDQPTLVLRCPECRSPLARKAGDLGCMACDRSFSMREGVVDLLGTVGQGNR